MRPYGGAHLRGPLAQLEEQLTLNQPVLGSSPRRLTTHPIWKQTSRPAQWTARGPLKSPRRTPRATLGHGGQEERP